MRKFIDRMLGNESHKSVNQRSGARTNTSSSVDNNNGSNKNGGNNDGNHRRRRTDISSPHVTITDSTTISEAVTEKSFGEQLLRAMIGRRAKQNEARLRNLLKKKFIDLSRKYQDLETSADDMATQVQAQQTDLYPLYRAYFLRHGISAGTVIRCACSTVDRSGDIHEHFVFTHNG